MSDLIEFLRARLDEDEAAARAASQIKASWTIHPDEDAPGLVQIGGVSMTGMHTDAWVDATDAAHIARHDPARVLHEVEAKRRILRHLAADADRYRDGDPTAIVSPEARALGEQARYFLRLLALPYSDHEEFDDAWRV